MLESVAMTYTDIISHYKSPKRAARYLRVTRQALSLWKKHGIAPDRQRYIQLVTRGKLKADQ